MNIQLVWLLIKQLNKASEILEQDGPMTKAEADIAQANKKLDITL